MNAKIEMMRWTSLRILHKPVPLPEQSSRYRLRVLVGRSTRDRVGEGVDIKGELQFETLLRVDGTFEGTLNSADGSVIIGKDRVPHRQCQGDEYSHY